MKEYKIYWENRCDFCDEINAFEYLSELLNKGYEVTIKLIKEEEAVENNGEIEEEEDDEWFDDHFQRRDD